MTQIEIPTHLLEAAKITPEELKANIAIQLFQQGRLTSDQAQELSGVSEAEFQELLTQQRLVDNLRSDFIAHFYLETGTPLSAIAGWSDLLLDNLADTDPLTPKQTEIVKHIRQASNELIELIHLLRRVLRVLAERPDIEDVDLGQLLKHIISSLNSNLSLQIDSVIPDNLPAVQVDREKVQQALEEVIKPIVTEGHRVQLIASYSDGKVRIELRVNEPRKFPGNPDWFVSSYVIRKYGGQIDWEHQQDQGLILAITLPTHKGTNK